ncbi:hypothetical protein [Pseudoduganella namucuonensis]|uniref:Uncharacterized protein n=1 Tax=Pseudoduganella namucuonensis TaxID=1035707 RepID=A0A1I7JFL3_9BURK|nr:hypothetical protein [Pseudoduganella namucuonensis]SFU83936.1 hypothetical protein SAMN05216552_101190 [Pseudoduganella namucuonensis]
MSTIPAAGPASRALRSADNSIGTWLTDLVTGAGSSPSHIIVTGVLGVVPGVGQAMDARDLIVGIIAIAKSPAAIGGWVELAITLVGCVPAAGDALKVGFKLMKQGHSFGRVLEAVSPKLRGNVEKYMRKVDWGMLAGEAKGLFTKVIAAFIDGLDSWIVKAVAGGPQVRQIIGELQAVQRSAPKMIDEAFGELKAMHAKMMGHELPGSTAAVAATTSKATRREAQEAFGATASRQQIQAARTERKLVAKRSQDVKANRASPNSTTASTKKKGQPKKRNWLSGIPAEHITDYYVKTKHVGFRKSNNGGKLTEEYSVPHNGIDHLWHNKVNIAKPFVVGETKSSIFDSFKLMAALPADLKANFDVLRANEAANPTPSGQPNIFHNQNRDQHANQRVPIDGSPANDESVRKGVNKPGVDKDGNPTNLATQMSHQWILRGVAKENLTANGQLLLPLINRFRTRRTLSPDAPAPYQRWISLVTGRQLHKHQQSKGAAHDIQVIMHLPDNILNR